MRIGDMARAAGVDPDTVCYYEKEGLLPLPFRQANGYRSYGAVHLERLTFIRHCRALDMPLADIRRLLAVKGSGQEGMNRQGACNEVNATVDQQLARVRERLAALHALEAQLVELRLRCGAPAVDAPCPILQQLEAPARGLPCVCHEATGDKGHSNALASGSLQ